MPYSCWLRLVFLAILCISKCSLFFKAQLKKKCHLLHKAFHDLLRTGICADSLNPRHFHHTFPKVWGLSASSFIHSFLQQTHSKHTFCERNVSSDENVNRPYIPGTHSQLGRQTIQKEFTINWVMGAHRKGSQFIFGRLRELWSICQRGRRETPPGRGMKNAQNQEMKIEHGRWARSHVWGSARRSAWWQNKTEKSREMRPESRNGRNTAVSPRSAKGS